MQIPSSILVEQSQARLQVAVQTNARLHMGFFDLHGGLGRKFGSIGLSLNAPQLALTATFADTLSVQSAAHIPQNSAEAITACAYQIAAKLLQTLQLKNNVAININAMIQEHAGLGSGTQLALSIGCAISQLFDLNLSTAQIAMLTGRGGRSGIGIAAFDQGGLLIDGGRVSSKENAQKVAIPPLLARYNFPEHWQVLLILDTSQPGIHGEEERAAFSQLPVFSENLAAHLCRHVLMQAMPAIAEQDLTVFGQSIQTLQAHVGDYFAPAQGGRYASKRVGAVLEYLEKNGVACFGQSSWGPTGFAVFENSTIASQYLQQLKTVFTDEKLDWQLCGASNKGACVTTEVINIV